MAYIEVILRELICERNPESNMIRRKIASRLNCDTAKVNEVAARFHLAINEAVKLREQLELTAVERNSLAVHLRMATHGKKRKNPLPTPQEWAKADHKSLVRMNFIGADEMTVGDYHTLMGK